MAELAPCWQVRCPHCVQTLDAIDLGIAALSAAGKTHLLRKCGMCQRLQGLYVEPKPTDLPNRAGPRCDLATHKSWQNKPLTEGLWKL